MPKKPKDPSTKVEERWVEWSDLEAGVNLKAGHPVILFLGGVAAAGTTTTADPGGPTGQTTKPSAGDETTTTKPPHSGDETTTTEKPDSPPTTTSDNGPGRTTSHSGGSPTTTSTNAPDQHTTSGPPTTTSNSPDQHTTSGPPTTSSRSEPSTTTSMQVPRTTSLHTPTTTTTHGPTTTTSQKPATEPTTTTTHGPTTTTSHKPATEPTTTSTKPPPTTTSHKPTTTSTHPATTTTLKTPNTQFVRFSAEHFDTAKSFPLPAGGKTIKNFQTIAGIANKDSTIQLLILGHTDTQANDTYNAQLSKERATAIQQYLVNDNNSWYAWYGNKDPQKVWGTLEDQWMLNSLPYGADGSPPDTPYYNRTPNGVPNADFTAAIKQFQGAVKEPATGTMNKSTRLKLILAYMQAEGTSVPASTVIKPLGCSFQNQATGQNDSTKQPGVNNPLNRRVEVFCFTGAIAPDPSAWAGDKKGTYAAWLKTLPDGVYDDSM